MFSEAFIAWLQRASNPLLDHFFLGMSGLGSETIYLVVLLLVYWCINRRIGRGLILAFLLTAMVNSIVKDSFGMARPSSELVRVLAFEWSYGFPSGHAQLAATVWGYLALQSRNKAFRIFAATLVGLVAFSRLYIGVHFLGDVLGGIALSALVLFVVRWWERRALLSNTGPLWRTIIAVVLPLVAAVLVQSNIGFRLAGVWVGFLLTDVVGREADRDTIDKRIPVWMMVGRAFVGLGVFAVVYTVVADYVPQGLPTFLAYGAMSTWVTAGAPAVFKWFRLGRWDRSPALASPMFMFALFALLTVGMTFASLEWTLRLEGADGVITTSVADSQLYPPRLPLDKAFLVLGHQGAAGLVPGNTLASFKQALDAGADVLEIDVRRTKDGHVVVIHDAVVDRVTNGKGAVTAFSLKELKELDAGYRFSPDGEGFPFRGQGLQIPTLAEVLAAFPNAYLNIDMKDHQPDMPEALLAVVDEAKARSRVIVASFDGPTIRRFRAMAPDVATALGQDEVTRFVILTRLGLGAFYKPPGRYMQVPPREGFFSLVTPHMVELAQRVGLDIHVWTINDRHNMSRLVEFGVQGIISDYPNLVTEVIASDKAAQ